MTYQVEEDDLVFLDTMGEQNLDGFDAGSTGGCFMSYLRSVPCRGSTHPTWGRAGDSIARKCHQATWRTPRQFRPRNIVAVTLTKSLGWHVSSSCHTVSSGGTSGYLETEERTRWIKIYREYVVSSCSGDSTYRVLCMPEYGNLDAFSPFRFELLLSSRTCQATRNIPTHQNGSNHASRLPWPSRQRCNTGGGTSLTSPAIAVSIARQLDMSALTSHDRDATDSTLEGNAVIVDAHGRSDSSGHDREMVET